MVMVRVRCCCCGGFVFGAGADIGEGVGLACSRVLQLDTMWDTLIVLDTLTHVACMACVALRAGSGFLWLTAMAALVAADYFAMNGVGHRATG